MRWARLLGTATLGAAAGLAVGYSTRPVPHSGEPRPAAVEQALRALDRADRRGDPTEVAPVAVALGAPDRFPPPWCDEVELVRRVADGAPGSLLAFAAGEPKGAARARALLWIATHGATEAERTHARDLLRERHPASWALGPEPSGGPR